MQAQTVLITGAARRVGRAIALSLAEKGWDIVIHYHSGKKHAEELASLIRKRKRQVTLITADLSDARQTAQIIPSLAKRGIKLSGLINNAAVFEKDSLASITPASWQRHMSTNLFAPLQLMRDFAAHYKGHEGNIINITDGMHGWSLSPTFLSYSLSKLGLANATLLLAVELAPRVRVNAIAPGPTLPGVMDRKDTFAKLKKIIPLARVSSPQEVCDAVQYILSASSLTGQTLLLSGGMHLPQTKE